MVKVLLADDERIIRDSVSTELRADGFAVDTACNGIEALERFRANTYDIVILDLMMPVMDGFDACQRIRETDPEVPVLMFSAYNSADNRIQGLRLGADDFIRKESTIEELRLKIATILRRAGRSEAAKPFAFGSAAVDPARFSLTLADHPAELLTLREAEILRYLAQNPDTPISWDMLQTRFWGSDNEGGDAMLKQAIYRLRLKLGNAADCLKTVRGFGIVYSATR